MLIYADKFKQKQFATLSFGHKAARRMETWLSKLSQLLSKSKPNPRGSNTRAWIRHHFFFDVMSSFPSTIARYLCLAFCFIFFFLTQSRKLKADKKRSEAAFSFCNLSHSYSMIDDPLLKGVPFIPFASFFSNLSYHYHLPFSICVNILLLLHAPPPTPLSKFDKMHSFRKF